MRKGTYELDAHLPLRHIAAIKQNVPRLRQHAADGRQLGLVVRKIAAVQHCIPKIQRSLAAMRYDMNGINVSSPLQIGDHLIQAVKVGIKDEYFSRLGQTVNQRLVICDSGIDENDVPCGHAGEPLSR